jgi:hypothetical protein
LGPAKARERLMFQKEVAFSTSTNSSLSLLGEIFGFDVLPNFGGEFDEKYFGLYYSLLKFSTREVRNFAVC